MQIGDRVKLNQEKASEHISKDALLDILHSVPGDFIIEDIENSNFFYNTGITINIGHWSLPEQWFDYARTIDEIVMENYLGF